MAETMSEPEKRRREAVNTPDGQLVERFLFAKEIMTGPLGAASEAELRRRLRLQNWTKGVSLSNLTQAAEAFAERVAEVPGFSRDKAARGTYMYMCGVQCALDSGDFWWNLASAAVLGSRARQRVEQGESPVRGGIQNLDGFSFFLPAGVTLADLASAGAI